MTSSSSSSEYSPHYLNIPEGQKDRISPLLFGKSEHKRAGGLLNLTIHLIIYRA